MTQLLEQAIDRLQSLPEKRQDHLASRILARIEEEQRAEETLLADIDAGLAQLAAGEGLDGETVMAELRARIEARL